MVKKYMLSILSIAFLVLTVDCCKASRILPENFDGHGLERTHLANIIQGAGFNRKTQYTSNFDADENNNEVWKYQARRLHEAWQIPENHAIELQECIDNNDIYIQYVYKLFNVDSPIEKFYFSLTCYNLKALNNMDTVMQDHSRGTHKFLKGYELHEQRPPSTAEDEVMRKFYQGVKFRGELENQVFLPGKAEKKLKKYKKETKKLSRSKSSRNNRSSISKNTENIPPLFGRELRNEIKSRSKPNKKRSSISIEPSPPLFGRELHDKIKKKKKHLI
jgi:hypothetical protein